MRQLVVPQRFARNLRQFRRKHPELKDAIDKRLVWLERNLHDPRLKTHKLTGRLKGRWAASITYEYRLVFRFDDETVTLLAIGTHDEVY